MSEDTEPKPLSERLNDHAEILDDYSPTPYSYIPELRADLREAVYALREINVCLAGTAQSEARPGFGAESQSTLDLVKSLAAELEAQRCVSEALRAQVDGLKKHAGHVPSMERVRQMHSAMPTSCLQNTVPDGGGHRIYAQGMEEQCYLCTVLDEVDRLNAEVERLRNIAND